MAKESGLGITTLSIDDDGGTPRDIRNDITNFDVATPYNPQETTGVDRSGVERILLLADGSGSENGIFNPAANRAHDVFSGDLRVLRTRNMVISAKTLSMEVLYTSYALTRAAGGELTWQTPFSLADGTVPTWT